MNGHARFRPGFTLLDLIAVIAATALIAAVLLPCMDARDQCGPPSCSSNLRQLGLAMLMYMQDYDDCFPSYQPDRDGNRWGEGPWPANFRSSSLWVAQLAPYVKNPGVFRCPQDASAGRNVATVVVPGSETPWQVSYGPNLLFVTPTDYRSSKRPVTSADVVHPEAKYLMGDCVTAFGFDPESIAYLRYPDYDPSRRQNGWSPEQFWALGRVAWPDSVAATVTRHQMGSSIMFADGHVKWLRHDQIPNNDGRRGREYQRLLDVMVPWQP